MLWRFWLRRLHIYSYVSIRSCRISMDAGDRILKVWRSGVMHVNNGHPSLASGMVVERGSETDTVHRMFLAPAFQSLRSVVSYVSSRAEGCMTEVDIWRQFLPALRFDASVGNLRSKPEPAPPSRSPTLSSQSQSMCLVRREYHLPATSGMM